VLLRLNVKGFKNLEDVTVRFGPLTCFVGLNGVGKSNLFDAIQFLKLLADHPIQEAAAGVRRSLAGGHAPLDLFLDRDPTGMLRFDADILIPKKVVDDFQRSADASATLLKYTLAFRYQREPAPRLELVEETLTYYKKGEAAKIIGFETSDSFIRKTIEATRRGEAFISTGPGKDDKHVIKLHQDGGSRGQPFNPGASPRTVLGGTNTVEYPTVLAARREMQSWRLLQLEPSAMRSPDPDDGSTGVTEHGRGVAATLFALNQRMLDARKAEAQRSLSAPPEVAASPAPAYQAAGDDSDNEPPADPAWDPYLAAVHTLRELNEQVDELRVERDAARNQLVLQARMRGMTEWLNPRSLSEGTLRFLALATLRLDPDARGLVALEEPENGIHPSRVRALVDLLRDMAVDPTCPPAPDNPLRQVILNTHSPDVVRRLYEEEILWVERYDSPRGARAHVRALRDGWRSDDDAIPKELIEEYIQGAPLGLRWSRQLTLFRGDA
jgi:predicted ATPase